jgi:hypothetical protein
MANGGSVLRVTEEAVFLVNRNSPLTKEEMLNSKYWPKAGGSLFWQKSLEGVLRCSAEAVRIMGWSMWEVYHNRLTQRTCAEWVIPFPFLVAA